MAFTIHLAGGDTDRRPGPITVTITALGAVPAGRLVRRAAARPGDRLIVSGTLGDAALGLRLLRDPTLAARWGLSEEEAQHLRDRYRRPRPRLGLRAALLGHARGAMDLSDGLAKDLGRMALASGVGAMIDTARLPLSSAARKALAAEPDLVVDVVAGGDDYEVLAAVAPQDAPGYATAARDVAVTEIGEITAGSTVALRDGAGRPLALAATGWDHF